MSRTAIIAGAGLLPAALAEAMATPPLICALDGFAPEGVTVDLVFRIERLALFLRHLEDQGVNNVVFAGAVQRPRLDPSVPLLVGARRAACKLCGNKMTPR